MPIWVGADDAGLPLKDLLVRHLQARGLDVHDASWRPGGADAREYPDVAAEVAHAVREGLTERAVLVCGTGIGMCIAANKIEGVRAALCHDVYSAERARKSNNAQIITLGARVIGPELAKTVLDAWLAADFAGGASARKVARLEQLDRLEHGHGAAGGERL